jgi:hypothetical protein
MVIAENEQPERPAMLMNHELLGLTRAKISLARIRV